MYNELIFRPLYNGLVYPMHLFPWMDIGIAVIIFTIIVKFILFPLSKSSLITQVRMKEVEPEVSAIKSKYKEDRQVQALKIMQLYKEKKIKPFAGILLILIQLPILFAIISVFYNIIPDIKADLLYFMTDLIHPKTEFLGFIDLTQKSLLLSVITAVIQYLQIRYSLASSSIGKQKFDPGADFSQQLAVSMNKQMKIAVPVIAFASTYWLIPAQFPAAAAIIAVYWSVSSLFTLVQELIIRRQYAKKKLLLETS